MFFYKKKVILGLTGSIALVKINQIYQLLTENGAEVKIIITKSAQKIIELENIKLIAKENCFFEEHLFSMETKMLHIDLAKFADLILIAPASANFIAKLANGFADDLLSTVCLATNSNIFIAPAMNVNMWENSIVNFNIEKLKAHNINIIGPNEGRQACGDIGYGRMAEPKEIISFLSESYRNKELFIGKKILITAGPTIEKIDPVRYISNFSSGKMGYALAKKASDMGAEVVLISGPSALTPPANVKLIKIQSADEMFKAVKNHINECNIFISCAAVSDYKVENISSHKLKKENLQHNILISKNIDILEYFSKNKPSTLFTVGFAAETEDIFENAKKKLKNKNLDILILNDVSSHNVFGSNYNHVYILNSETPAIEEIKLTKKTIIAEKILLKIHQLRNYL